MIAGWPSGAGSPRSSGSWAGRAVAWSGDHTLSGRRPRVGEVVLPAPVLGQVEGESAGACGDPGGDVDQVAADGAGAGLGVEGGGEVAGGAGEVVGLVGRGCQGQPGGRSR